MKYESTILIVDDEAIGRENMEEMLITQGYNLAFAETGAECLTMAAELTPDVILLDVMMPGMDGFEVCRRLRTHPLLAEVPIILVTALDDRDSRLAGIGAGADDFISKPLDRVELRARLRTITRLNRYRHLLAQRARFTWVVDQAEDAYLMVNDQDELLYANAQARLYLGLPQDEGTPLSGHFLELVTQHYQCTPPEAWANWPQPRPAMQSPRYLVQPESDTTDTSWLQVDLMDMTTTLSEGYLIRLQDVTATIIEERLQWSFHAQISHKLKTPLTHLIGGVELLMNEKANLSEEQKNSFLSLVHQACLQLQSTMNRIFQFVEAPELIQPGRGKCSLSEFSTIIHEISQTLELKRVNIRPEGIDNLDEAYVGISRQAIEMVLRELLNNSKKFHPTQSPTLDIHFRPVSGGIRVQVGDDGLTPSPEQLAKMWSPYYQVEKYFTGQMPGMGLGLSTAALVILGVGGTCKANSRKDQPGIVVEFVLPTRRHK